jgi:hypothetical protein
MFRLSIWTAYAKPGYITWFAWVELSTPIGSLADAKVSTTLELFSTTSELIPATVVVEFIKQVLLRM